MTTHLRARAAQAGALLALVGGIMAATASPALAAGPEAQIDSVQNEVESGKQVQLRYTVRNTDEIDVPGQNNRVQVSVNTGGLQCGNCSNSVTLGAGKEQSFTSTLTAPDVPAGQTRTFRVQILLNNRASGGTEEIKVSGPDKPQSVRQVSGKVRDDKGKRVTGAQVIMQDTANHRYETTSNGDGNFAFSSSDSKPIAIGTIVVGAGKDGYDPATVSVQGGANKNVTVNLTLPVKAGASPSATPSATEETTAPADDEATDEATNEASTPPLNADKTAGEDGNGSLLFIILGGLLVAAGVGAIVLVLMRRKNSGNDDGDPDGLPGGPGPGPVGRGGAYGNDATRVAAPVGAGRGHDATMVAGAGGMADAPTVLQRAVPPEDEFPDPYGVPAQQPAYGGAGQQYGAPTQTYGSAVPAQGGGYDDEQYYDDGQAAGGYYGGQQQAAPPQQRYDEPTGMYQPQDYADDYQQPQQPQGVPGGQYGRGAAPQQPAQYDAWDQGGAGNYGAGAGGYEAGYDNGYDQHGAAPGGGYDAGYDNGYDQRGGAGGGTYGAGGGGYQPQQPQQAGYDAGYDNGYDSGGGYDQRGGYDQQQGGGQGGYYGADQGGHRGGPPRQGPPATEEPARPGQRRLPWMDD